MPAINQLNYLNAIQITRNNFLKSANNTVTRIIMRGKLF